MPLIKRKPIPYRPAPKALFDDAEVWVMRETGEVFTTYQSYLNRLEFYDQRTFTCQITGHTNLSFWEALKSETHGSRELEKTFPDLLREPVLRKVQFSTISRIDELVAWLYDTYKEDFFPGEEVEVIDTRLNNRHAGRIVEKVMMPERRWPDGTLEREATARYLIALDNGREAMHDQHSVQRKRRTFTKQVLRSFLKNTITREKWDGAPWIVKPEIAKHYPGIPIEVPAHLQYDTIMADKKAQAAMKKARSDDAFAQFNIDDQGRLEPKVGERITLEQLAKAQEQFDAAIMNGGKPPKAPKEPKESRQARHAREAQEGKAEATKWPIEDLDVPPRRGVEEPKRPAFITTDELAQTLHLDELASPPKVASMSALLETWNALCVFGQFFVLDGFTFDDFMQAMFVTSEHVQCELFREVFCAVLRRMVNQDGEVLPRLVKAAVQDDAEEAEDDEDDSDESDEEGEDEEEEEEEEENDGGEDKDKNEASREASADAKDEDDADDTKMTNGETREKTHQAREMAAEANWVDILRRRAFQDDAWYFVVVGVLECLSRSPALEKLCDPILEQLAPLDEDTTLDVARQGLLSLDGNMRAEALQILTMLVFETKPFKDFMEQCMADATDTRKQKLGLQSQKKQLLADLQRLDEERKLTRPDNLEDSPDEAEQDSEVKDVSISSAMHETTEDEEDEEDEDAPPRKHSRRVSNRHASLKRKREEDEARREADKKRRAETEESNKYHKILADIEELKEQIRELESDINFYDTDLRENNCHRTKNLGYDRYGNRYVWFERNGMPLAGERASRGGNAHTQTTISGANPTETYAPNYANGQLWIQGPYCITSDGDDANEDFWSEQRHGESIRSRRLRDEDGQSLTSPHEWASYARASDLDALITYLDNRGQRERALRRELELFRSEISDCMERRSANLEGVALRQAARQEARERGIATRKKAGFSADRHALTLKYPALLWVNGTALSRFGRPLAEGQPPPSARGGHLRKAAASAASTIAKAAKAAGANTDAAAASESVAVMSTGVQPRKKRGVAAATSAPSGLVNGNSNAHAHGRDSDSQASSAAAPRKYKTKAKVSKGNEKVNAKGDDNGKGKNKSIVVVVPPDPPQKRATRAGGRR